MIFMFQVLTILIICVHNAERLSSEQLHLQTGITTPKATWIDLFLYEPNGEVTFATGSHLMFSPNLQLLPGPLVHVSWKGHCLAPTSWMYKHTASDHTVLMGYAEA